MSCYVRHLDDILKASDVESNKDNLKRMDKFIREILKTDEACPEVWKQLKAILADGKKKKDLVRRLKKEFVKV
ncbi:MAG: hypothetical protein AMJ73_06910 [candidate division Zixibacteria bacterium SM1_73]|nr:MAG: hypothetical protein AMJ73_06910 [candidate division Zixibacteria bacterium SM1_73]